ncbi:MAG: hypothetical protein HY200_04980 [Nitrospirae bacterium]|nr:hypothetical protein [Nitrospirota bacterium]MBI3594292.1 hypothetical protein [Nitrospirota bacterium]
MKTLFLLLGWIISGFLPLPAFAQSVDFDFHIGNRPAPPPIVLEAPPRMVYSDGLRAYIAVGIPQDLFYFEHVYFYHHGGDWYRSPYYKGPWVHTEGPGIPPGLNRYRMEEIREIKRHAREDHREQKLRFRERHFQAEEHHDRHGREIR